jgi:cytochrome b
MPDILENEERRKRRDPEIIVWDRVVRIGHWLLAFSFATLYLEYKKFPLHPYAGYLVFSIITFRIIWGFVGSGAARFSSFWYSPREMYNYARSAFRGHAAYHFSHNPMGAAMVYALIVTIFLNCFLGLLAYSAQQQLGPFGALVPDTYEELLIRIHSILGHLTAILVICHMCGVIWAARLHRENYALAMLNGIRRIPRAVSVPEGALRPVLNGVFKPQCEHARIWLAYRRPVLGTLILMLCIGLLTFPMIKFLVMLNKLLPAY